MISALFQKIAELFERGNPNRPFTGDDLPDVPPGVQDALRWRIEQGHIRRRPKGSETIGAEHFEPHWRG
jgi:hypothetical protein